VEDEGVIRREREAEIVFFGKFVTILSAEIEDFLARTAGYAEAKDAGVCPSEIGVEVSRIGGPT
jgi:hypothetical protein